MSTGGVLTTVSDRAKKENFTQIDPKEILAKINQLPMTKWNYIGEDPSIKHIAPMAQDFHALFGLNGESSGKTAFNIDPSKMISSIDPAGIALVGIQALDQKIEELKTSSISNIDIKDMKNKIEILEKENANLKKENINLKSEVKSKANLKDLDKLKAELEELKLQMLKKSTQTK
jgi:hypothetical protein